MTLDCTGIPENVRMHAGCGVFVFLHALAMLLEHQLCAGCATKIHVHADASQYAELFSHEKRNAFVRAQANGVFVFGFMRAHKSHAFWLPKQQFAWLQKSMWAPGRVF